MKAIVGLGNPGSDYSGTRHNVGFEVIDELSRRWKVALKSWKAVADLAIVGGRDVLLAKPQTFMNLSGDAVQRIAAYFKLAPSDMLLVMDEVQLPPGRLRIRRQGSAGGHNGLKSIIERLGSGDVPRLRIGVGRGDPRWDLADHVLAPFRSDEREIMAQAVIRAADAAELFVADGIGVAMNRFNVSDDRGGDEDSR